MSREQIALSLAVLLAAWAFTQRSGGGMAEPGLAGVPWGDSPWQAVLEAAAETTQLEADAGYLSFGGRLMEAPTLAP